MDAPNVLEIVRAKLARKKAETRRMARWISAKKLAIKWKKKEMKRVKKVNEQMIAVNRRMQKMVDDFLVAAETESANPETAKIWTGIAVEQVIEGMVDLNLDGNSSGSAAN